MNTNLLPILGLMFTLIACSSGVAGAPSPAAPTPAAPTPGPSAPATPGPTNPTADTDPDLNGRTFLSVKVTDGGADKPLVPNSVIRISFTDGQIGASAGCNTIGGTYTLDGDTLIFQGGGMTEMGCDPARHAQDDWLVAILGSRPTIGLTGNDLVLTSGTTAITMLDKEIADPDRDLVGPTWTLTSIITGEAVSSVPAGVTSSVTFHEDGSVDIHFGCNTGGGRYAIDGDTITFSDLISTMMACIDAAGQVEAAVIAVLESMTITYAIDAGSLTLMAGDIGLQFSAN